jgi:hypothetical protein
MELYALRRQHSLSPEAIAEHFQISTEDVTLILRHTVQPMVISDSSGQLGYWQSDPIQNTKRNE